MRILLRALYACAHLIWSLSTSIFFMAPVDARVLRVTPGRAQTFLVSPEFLQFGTLLKETERAIAQCLARVEDLESPGCSWTHVSGVSASLSE